MWTQDRSSGCSGTTVPGTRLVDGGLPTTASCALAWLGVCGSWVREEWSLNRNQRRDISLEQNLGLSTRADVLGQTILLPAPVASVEATTHPLCWIELGIRGVESAGGAARGAAVGASCPCWEAGLPEQLGQRKPRAGSTAGSTAEDLCWGPALP